MENTKFTIIIPVYNTKKQFLDDCMNSVFSQTYRNYEVIIVDDGSNQETKKLLKKYEKTCLIIHQENKGISGSRISGLKKAAGDYIIHLDSDDILNVQALEKINNVIEKYNPDVIIQDPSRFYNSIDKIEFRNTYFKEGILTKEETLEELVKLHINSICNKFVRKELYDNLENNIDTSFINGEDLQQSTYVVLQAKTIYYISDPLYYYRLNEDDRDYYKTINLNDVNYTLPTYNMLFKNKHSYDYLLKSYKQFVCNNCIYTGFKICALYSNKKEKYQYLDELNTQPIINILKTIEVPMPFVTKTLFNYLTEKNYFMFNLLANIYKLIYGFDKSTFK